MPSKPGSRPIGGELVAAAVGDGNGNEEADARLFTLLAAWLASAGAVAGLLRGPNSAARPGPASARGRATADPDRPGHERALEGGRPRAPRRP